MLLVGFMGAGKTSVGKLVAKGLGWRFIDFDVVLAGEADMEISEIFARHGERYFRVLEAGVAARLLAEEEVVLGSGGGWSAVPGRLAALPEGTATFWLAVSAKRALERVAGHPEVRPLLAGGDALERAEALLMARAPFYRQARWTVDTERSTVEDVSARILTILAEETP